MKLTQKKHIGIVGTGFIARGLMHALQYDPYLEVSRVLTRRNFSSIKELPVSNKVLTHDVNTLINNSDIVVEASGDVIYGTEVVEHILLTGMPVVTMNAELQITTGSMLARLGTLIEAEGDQPGTLAALDNEVRSMGFNPVVYGNIKGFMNHNPSPEDMKYWAKRQGIRLDKVTAFTDGTKVEIEQALVANGLGATIATNGMQALVCNSYEDGARMLGSLALVEKKILSDYVVSPGAPAGVFIAATHDSPQAPYLEYLKLGKGPIYTIIKPFHLCHLEIRKTLRHVLTNSDEYTFNNSLNPQVQVVSIAKEDLKPGDKISHGIGSFLLRGKAVLIKDKPTAVPIGLMSGAVVEKPIKAGEIVDSSQVSLPYTRAKELWDAFMFEKYQTPHPEHSLKNYSFHARRRKKTNGIWYRFLREGDANYQIDKIEA